jgi:hypothetical protein
MIGEQNLEEEELEDAGGKRRRVCEEDADDTDNNDTDDDHDDTDGNANPIRRDYSCVLYMRIAHKVTFSIMRFLFARTHLHETHACALAAPLGKILFYSIEGAHFVRVRALIAVHRCASHAAVVGVVD